MKLIHSTALALLTAVACAGAQASETYTYDSNPILGFGGGPGVEFTFSFTVSTPLADGSYVFHDPSELPAGFSYVATDGYMTLDSTPDLYGVSEPQLTIAGGKITAYSIYVQDLSMPPNPNYGYPLIYLAKDSTQTLDEVQLVDPANPNIVGFDFLGAHDPIADRDISDTPGFWTYSSPVSSVPEPAGLLSMSTALALLAGLARRRRS